MKSKAAETDTDAESPTSQLHAPEGARWPSTDETQVGLVPSRILAKIHVALCILGVLVAAELTRIHLFVHTDPSYHSLCALSEELNCETVAGSPHSVFWGLPVSVWGLMAYCGMGLLSVWGTTSKRLHRTWPWGILLFLSTFSVAVSVVLAVISATQASSLCLFCMASYVINLLLLGVCVVALKQSSARAVSLAKADIAALLRRRTLSVGLSLGTLTLVGSVEAFVSTYWSSSAWSSLPRLESGMDENGHHWLGGSEPAITIVEFSDYECAHCRAAHKQIRELVAKHKERVRLVHRHLPLDMQCHPGIGRHFHVHACVFAEAAECAALQGRFWEMNDALFSVQETTKAANVVLSELAVRIGLNRGEFTRCLESHRTLPKISDDIQAALSRSLEGTPSFLIGEQLYLGSVPESELLAHLRDHATSHQSGPTFPPRQKEYCDGSKPPGDCTCSTP